MVLSEMIQKLQTTRLYAILDTGYSDPRRWPELAQQLIAGGVGAIQIRAKQSSAAEIQIWALTIQPFLQEAGVPLIINDHPEVAGFIGAEACHIGQDDLSVAEARERSGGKIIGKSTHSLTQAVAAQAEGADYIGFGPIFPTLTKPDYQPIGMEDIAEMARRIHIPHFCIGGIKLEHVSGLKARGARRVVIVSGLLRSPNPEVYARDVIRELGEPSP
jgi:thiamine-phosphate pyrophosphorylase